jgi:hypothetical protein
MFTLRVADVLGAVVSGVMDIRLHRMWVNFLVLGRLPHMPCLPIRLTFIPEILPVRCTSVRAGRRALEEPLELFGGGLM